MEFPNPRAYVPFIRLSNDSLLIYSGLGEFNTFGSNSQNYFDMWRFDPLPNLWVLLFGNVSANPTGFDVSDYGPTPAARDSFGIVVLKNDSVMLFGGFISFNFIDGAVIANDMWRFDPLINVWTLLFGNYTQVPGIYTPGGYPGSRYSQAMILLENDSMIIFGGYGTDVNNGLGQLNDLWRYDLLTNLWTFIIGDNVSSLNNEMLDDYGRGIPSGNQGPNTFILLSNQSILLYGGFGSDDFGVGQGTSIPLKRIWILKICYCPQQGCLLNVSNVIPNHYGVNCDTCVCVNGTCVDGINGTGLCSSCDPNYFGPNCNETPSSSSSSENPSSSSSESPSSSSESSSGNAPTSSTSNKSLTKPATTTEHVNTEKSNISKLLPTIFIFIFFI